MALMSDELGLSCLVSSRGHRLHPAPTGYIQHEPELLEASSPIRRQLLGANGDNSDPLENDGSQGGDIGQSVAGQHWFPSDFEKVGCLLLTQRFSPAGPAHGYHLFNLMKKGTQVVRR